MTYPGHLGARYTGLGTQTGAQIRFFQFVIQFTYLENVLQRNLRTGTAREFIFRASGGTRFKNFRQPW